MASGIERKGQVNWQNRCEGVAKATAHLAIALLAIAAVANLFEIMDGQSLLFQGSATLIFSVSIIHICRLACKRFSLNPNQLLLLSVFLAGISIGAARNYITHLDRENVLSCEREMAAHWEEWVTQTDARCRIAEDGKPFVLGVPVKLTHAWGEKHEYRSFQMGEVNIPEEKTHAFIPLDKFSDLPDGIKNLKELLGPAHFKYLLVNETANKNYIEIHGDAHYKKEFNPCREGFKHKEIHKCFSQAALNFLCKMELLRFE